MDATKIVFANVRHRILRHHQEGVADAEAVFGRYLGNADNVEVPIQDICEQHCREDFGGTFPTLDQWLERTRLEDIPFLNGETLPDTMSVPGDCQNRYGGSIEQHAALVGWFLGDSLSDPRRRILRMHSHGIFDFEKTHGLCIDCAGRPTPSRVIGEYIVQRLMPRRFIPSATAWLQCVRRPTWMKEPTKLSV